MPGRRRKVREETRSSDCCACLSGPWSAAGGRPERYAQESLVVCVEYTCKNRFSRASEVEYTYLQIVETVPTLGMAYGLKWLSTIHTGLPVTNSHRFPVSTQRELVL